MTSIIGKKRGMTQVFAQDGTVTPVTVIEATPGTVVQIKTKERDGYEAAKIGFFEILKESRMTKPMLGLFKKAGTKSFSLLREFKMEGLAVGDVLSVERFAKGDVVAVRGKSKGKGFQGTMKRHNFSGGAGSHGAMCDREPGSIGASSYPSHVWRGKRMAGHMGNENVCVKNLTIVEVLPEQNVILIKGAVPGAINAVVEIRKEN